jgi:phosphatidylinositol alpha-1,6-mannosyltransferase
MLVTRNFPPLLGGMEKVNQHLLAALQEGRRTVLCGPVGCTEFVSPLVTVRENRIKPLPVFLLMALWHALILAWRYRPQWILAGSGLAAPMAFLAARCTGARSVVYLHGLDIVAPSHIYQRFWLPFIRRCDLVLANSAHTVQLALRHGISEDKLHILHPGTDLPVMDAEIARAFRQNQGFGQNRLLLSVGRLTRRKGLVQFVEQALPGIVASCPDVLLVIIGGEASDALNTTSGSESARILAAAGNAGVGQNVRLLGRCDDQTVHAAYQAANLHIFPVLDLPGDVEGFGMVALEAAAHGLPTVAFAVGGVPDAVQDGGTGALISSGDYERMSEAVIRWLAQPHESSVINACRTFAAAKAWPVFGRHLRDLLDSQHV